MSNIDAGKFYFLLDNFFSDFPDSDLQRNKEMINGQKHSRPCFYSFCDDNSELYWFIPISSGVQKYRKVYDNKIKKYHRCDTIMFGNVLGYEKAFLIQNMFPTIPKYIHECYLHKNSGIPVEVQEDFRDKLISRAKKVLNDYRKGNTFLIFPDVISIEAKLRYLLTQQQKNVVTQVVEQK